MSGLRGNGGGGGTSDGSSFDDSSDPENVCTVIPLGGASTVSMSCNDLPPLSPSSSPPTRSTMSCEVLPPLPPLLPPVSPRFF